MGARYVPLMQSECHAGLFRVPGLVSSAIPRGDGWKPLLLLSLACILSISCSGEKPTWVVIERPFVIDDPDTQSEDAEIDGQARQVITTPRRIHFQGGRTSGNSQATVYPVPPQWNGRAVAIAREIRKPRGAGHERLPPLVLRVKNGKVRVPHPVPGSGRLLTSGVLIPQRSKNWESRLFRVPPEAVLEGSVGLSPIIPAEQRASVQVRIFVSQKGGDELLFETTLRGNNEAWDDYRLDLGRFEGEEIRLAISSAPASDEPGYAIPLVSSPLLLAPAPETRMNFIVISLDTLRADHVGVYGASPSLTPHLDRFANSGVVFTDAMTTFPSTTASHMSLFTGLYPAAHQVFQPGPRLKSEIPILTSALAEAGYRTGAITENGMLMRSVGFGRGFDTYTELRTQEPLDTPGFVSEVVDRAEAWLSRYGRERFFLFLHTYEVHAPYTPPASAKPTKEQTAGMGPNRSAYAAEVIYTDREIGRLLDFLEKQGLSANTAVLITSDHGESFGEHGHTGHGSSLFETELHIPFLLRIPGSAAAGLRVERVVSLVDVAPTVLELANLPIPEKTQGKSLVRLSAGKEDEAIRNRTVFAQRKPGGDRYEVAARQGKTKWISAVDKSDATEVDLETDPGENTPRRSQAIHKQAKGLHRDYRSEGDALFSVFGKAEAPVNLDAAARDRLRALGYIDVAESGLPEKSGNNEPKNENQPSSH